MYSKLGIVAINTNISFFEITVIVTMFRQNVIMVAFLCHGQMSLVHCSVSSRLQDQLSILSLLFVIYRFIVALNLSQFYNHKRTLEKLRLFLNQFCFHFLHSWRTANHYAGAITSAPEDHNLHTGTRIPDRTHWKYRPISLHSQIQR